MQGLRKGEWSAITQVKVFSPEICLVALGQGFLHSEASSAARDNGECVSDVPGSQAIAGHSRIHSGTWDSHVVLKRSLHQAEEARRGYGGMAVGPVHIRGESTSVLRLWVQVRLRVVMESAKPCAIVS